MTGAAAACRQQVPDDEALSPYDETVPGPAPDEPLAARFAELRRLRGADPAALGAVREVVLVVSSSRGGSTLLSELLRHTRELVTLPGEVNPYVVVAQLSPHRRRSVLAGEIAAELGRPAATFAEVGVEDLVLQTAWRMAAQWPTVPLRPDEVDRAVRSAVARLPRTGGAAAFTAALLDELGGPSRGLDLRRYDGADAYADPSPVPGGPAAETVVEMAPYRLVQPWRRATADDLAGSTVVLATPRNSFRINHLQGLFPAARVRLLHLTRNPAAAVNGLIDGWLHHGFFNCRVPRQLRIAGYSDRFPGWGRQWWKYDVPPGWESVVSAPLARVAALQWSTAHEAVLSAAGAGGWDVHRLAYEDVVGPAEARGRAAAGLADWLELGDRTGFTARVTEGLAPVMATETPRPARWRARERELGPVVRDAGIGELAVRLGYREDPATWR